MDKKELFICECNSIEHQIVMSYFEDEKEVYCEKNGFATSFNDIFKYDAN